MSFLSKPLSIRLRQEEYDQIELCMIKNKDRYFNISHFLRVAMMREIKRCRDENKNPKS